MPLAVAADTWVDRHLEALNAGLLTFPALLEMLHSGKYTGPVTFHFIHGVATAVEIPRPTVRLALRHAPHA